MNPYSTWESDRRRTIRELQSLEEKVRSHARNSKIASSVGTGTSIVSGVGAAICYLIAPVTFGASLVPAAALTGVSVAGAFTSVGSSFVNYLIETDYMKDVQAALDKDRASFKVLERYVQRARALTSEDVLNVGIKIPDAIRYGAKIVSKLSVSEKAACTLLKLGQTARFAGHIVSVVAIPLDIIFFIKDAIDLANGDVSAAADCIHKLVRELQEEYDEIISETY